MSPSPSPPGPELPLSPPGAGPGGRRSPWRWAVAGLAAVTGGLTLLTVVGVVVVLAVLGSTFQGCEAGEFSSSGSGGGFGLSGPGPGTDSLRLPVTVAPRHDLVDGQVVYVTSTAFSPHTVVGVAVCLAEADVEAQGVDACDTDGGARFATDAGGHLAAALLVPRVITVQGEAHDCAAAPERCLVVAAHVWDYDRSGGQPVSFAPDLGPVALDPAGPRPRSDRLPVTATPDGPVPAGTIIEVTASGFVPGEPVLVAPCTALFTSAEAWEACEPADTSVAFRAVLGDVEDVADHADGDGRVTTTVVVPGTVTPYQGPPTSCRPAEACAVVVAAAADLRRSAVLPLTLAG